jgi:endonuclease G
MAAHFDSDPELERLLVERARGAATRWDKRSTIRAEKAAALSENRLLDADSPSRLAQRINRLVADVRISAREGRRPGSQALETLVARRTPVVAEELTASLVKEVILGAKNFLSVEFLERGIHSARTVGRILIHTASGQRARGTGFLISPDLILTNEHVLRSKEQAALCSIEMDHEENRFGPAIQSQIFKLEPSRFFINDAAMDFALVAVAASSERGASITPYGWLPLSAAQGKIAVTLGDYLNVIQHPLGREKEIVIRENRLLDIAVSAADEADLSAFLHYEADTEKGSSGSPVFNDEWEVVALHHSGVPRTDASGKWLSKSGEVWKEGIDPVADIHWIANEGTRVSSLLAEFQRADLPDSQRNLLDRVLNQPQTATPALRTRNEAGEDAAPETAPARPDQPARSGPLRRETEDVNSTTLEIPLRVQVSLGSAHRSRETASGRPHRRSPDRQLAEEALAAPEDYADREGYDRNFLGVNVPFPTMKPNPRFGKILVVPRPARRRDIHELRYHRFSIIMNELRRLAYVSACNLHYDPPAEVSRDEGSQSWRRDRRIDDTHQLGARYYDGNDYDKGHLTRRDDVAWGSDDEDALAGNWDSFHYTNAAPQHFLYNRSDHFTGAGLDLWGDLENHISEEADAKRNKLSIFSGPIFGDDATDKPYLDALVPLRYFKIVVWRDRGQPPGALGFVLDQADLIENLAKEAIDPGDFVVRQKRISTIERDLDIGFGPISQWDRMPMRRRREALEDEGIQLNSVNDIMIAKQ